MNSTRRARNDVLLVAATLVGAALSLGCTQQTIGGPCDPFEGDDPSQPCRQQMYFPTGMVIDPSGDTLYVSNGNSDLRYGGGTVQAIDVGAFECAYARARHDTARVTTLCQRYGLLLCAMDWADSNFSSTLPAGCDAAALGALFNEKNRARVGNHGLCRPDLLDSSILECDEQLLMAGALAAPGTASQGAVRIGNFSGELRVQPKHPNQSGDRRLWVAVRGDPSITFIDVKRDADGVRLDCGNISGPLGDCQNNRITVRDYHDANHQPLLPGAPGSEQPGNSGILCQGNPDKCVSIPGEPFGLAYDEGSYKNAKPLCHDNSACPTDGTSCPDKLDCTFDLCRDGTACPANGKCADGLACIEGKYLGYQHLLVSHLLGGEVMLINAAAEKPTSTTAVAPPEAVVLDVRGVGFNADSAGRRGGFSLAAREPGNPRSLWYATSRTNPVISMFRVGFSNIVLPVGLQTLLGPFAVGEDVRDLVFDTCADRGPNNNGCRAFVVQDHPPSLFTLDTRVDPMKVPAGLPQNVVTDIVSVCQNPSHLGFRTFEDPLGGPRRNRVYVLCYAANQMAVVDPDLSRVVDSVLVGRGPNEIAFNFGPGIDADKQPSSLRRAFVTNFLDNSISVVDLEPGSDTENHVVGRIGFTEPPRLQ